jgi:hypothetical protein
MLIIRKEQMQVFEQAAVKSFESRMVEHLKKEFPKHSEAMGEGALQKVVRRGRERAAKYGLAGERSVRLYLELMLMLGSGFDEDPQLPWAADVLRNQGAGEETARIDALYKKVGEYAHRTAGPKNEYLDRALRALPAEKLEGYIGSGAPSFEDYMLRRLGMLYREKAEAVGREPLRVMIARGVEGARRTRLITEAGVMLYVFLMFFLGSGFASDPQFRWASEILKDETLGEPAKKATRLHEAAMAYLGRFLPRQTK